MVNLEASKLEYKFASRIAKRAIRLCIGRAQLDCTQLEMDIVACHLNGCPLDLERLLAAEEGEFLHDVLGIRRYIDRATGELTECFVPRFSQSEQQYTEDA